MSIPVLLDPKTFFMLAVSAIFLVSSHQRPDPIAYKLFVL
ncbi:hypothetical protein SynBIOSU31_02704 [Synechococcus sp. BIOS-U3-1]|nr:hypothetical protein SynBIOSU31_02704 [Synechococcus sp. BIOS-U3-1]